MGVDRAGSAEQQSGEVWEAHAALRSLETNRSSDHGGEEDVRALNAYASAKAAVARLLEPGDTAGGDTAELAQLIDNLKSDVRDQLKTQKSAIAALSANVPEIRRACTKVVSPNAARRS